MIVSMNLSAVLVLSTLAWPGNLDKALETAKAEQKPVLVYVFDSL